MKEILRGTRVVGSFPNGYSVMMLVGARLRHLSTTKWGIRQYLNTCKHYGEDVKKKKESCASQTDLLLRNSMGGSFFGFANAHETLISQNQMCRKYRTLPSEKPRNLYKGGNEIVILHVLRIFMARKILWSGGQFIKAPYLNLFGWEE